MSGEGYRGELGAAQARIAQLEQRLRDAERSTSPEIERLEAAQALMAKGVPTRAKVLLGVMVSLLAAVMLPIVLIEYRYEGAMAAAIALTLLVGSTVGFGFLMRFIVTRQRIAQAEHLAKKLQEARRMQRLEDEVRAMRESKAEVRVAQEPAPPDEHDADTESAQARRRPAF